MKRIINHNSISDRALALRLFELANIDPGTIASDSITIYRNHVEYKEIQFIELKYQGATVITIQRNPRTLEAITKTRTIRNPLPASAWARPMLTPEERLRSTLNKFNSSAHKTDTEIQRFRDAINELALAVSHAEFGVYPQRYVMGVEAGE
ncbi:hypothetical protein [Timonella senegalensis]|uniref:hypothetical protein n=1 Tax=Timonella senegalensis TaxID=1465825 RepID=UPI0002FD6E8B|nr:hypothetical protein [Timonella senegalensis]